MKNFKTYHHFPKSWNAAVLNVIFKVDHIKRAACLYCCSVAQHILSTHILSPLCQKTASVPNRL